MRKNKKVIISLITIIILSVLSFILFKFIAPSYKNSALGSKNLNNVVSNDQINFFDPTKLPLVDFKKGRDLSSEYVNYYGADGQTLSVEAKNYHDLQERILFKTGESPHPLDVALMGVKNNIALLSVAGEQHPYDISNPPSTVYSVDARAGVIDKTEKISATVVLDAERIVFIRDRDIFAYKLGTQKFIQVPHSNEIPENEVYQFSYGMISDDPSFDGKNFKIRRCVLAREVTEKEICTLQSFEFPN